MYSIPVLISDNEAPLYLIRVECKFFLSSNSWNMEQALYLIRVECK